MTGWLASVTNADEALQVLAAGADIVDAKNPRVGALGALPLRTVGSIVNAVNGQGRVSATIGDFFSMEAHAIARSVEAMAGTGVDFVKIGLFPSPALQDCLDTIAPLCRKHRLVAVLFADRSPDILLVDRLADLGFVGVMLDTMNKGTGGLLQHQSVARLASFVARAKRLNLISGLAGSLRASDIPVLGPLGSDYLGFRGALCVKNARTQALDPGALTAITRAMGRKRDVI